MRNISLYIAFWLFGVFAVPSAFANYNELAVPEEWASTQEVLDGVVESDGMYFPDDVVITGPDIRIVLGRIIPDLDEYTKKLIDQIEGIWIRNLSGELYIEVRFTENHSVLPIRPFKKTKRGEPYRVEFNKVFSFYLESKRDTLRIHNIDGIKLMVKIPILPDGILPRELFLDSSRETLSVSALALNGRVALEGTLNVRSKKFEGINWKKTLAKNWKLIFSVLTFIRG